MKLKKEKAPFLTVPEAEVLASVAVDACDALKAADATFNKQLNKAKREYEVRMRSQRIRVERLLKVVTNNLDAHKVELCRKGKNTAHLPTVDLSWIVRASILIENGKRSVRYLERREMEEYLRRDVTVDKQHCHKHLDVALKIPGLAVLDKGYLVIKVRGRKEPVSEELWSRRRRKKTRSKAQTHKLTII